MTPLNDTLTDVPGILVGHATDLAAATGCTVIICPDGTIGGVDQRGGAPGTRETDLLRPMHLVETVNAVMLSGGSAYGLASADGAMRYLEAHGIGYKATGGRFIVPIIPTAILMDLGIGLSTVRPDAAMGYTACEAATADPVVQGTVGAGTGCRIGAMLGNNFATKGGIGSASIDLGDGLIVAALIAVNSVGDVLDEQGQIIAGLRASLDGNEFIGMMNAIKNTARMVETPTRDTNTVIGVVATNARLTKEQVNKVAQMAQNGIAKSVCPAHTMFDGDTIFALATGDIPANVNAIGAFAAEVVARAIRKAVYAATSLHDVRAVKD
ncbi:MAG: P1 family peptidase [Anaerolineae bacterium]|nr:P1 family peptidase [Anaerolineae bacterium]